jgi:flagellin-like protein
MKGITPVIAVILLLLITLSMTGFAFIFFTRIASTATNATESQLRTDLDRQAKKIVIDNVDATNAIVYVRNTGTQMIRATELAIYINGAKGTCTGTVFTDVSPGQTTSCDFSAGSCASGAIIKITAPGNFDELDC